ncbi:MAG: RDD family protein, partial [Psychrobacillus sp.]
HMKEVMLMRMNATFLLRFKAFMIDYIFILVYLALLFVINVFLFPSLQAFFNGSLIVAQVTGFLMVTFPVSLVFDSPIGGQSIGKRKTGIQVVNKNGEAISLLRTTFRTVLKFLPWELSHYLVYRLVYIGDGEIPFSYYQLVD